MGILDSIGNTVSSAIDTVKEAVGIDAAPPAPPPAAEAPPEAPPAVAPPSNRAMSGGFAAVQLQAQMAASAANPTGVASPSGAVYKPTGPKVPDDTKLPKDGGEILDNFSQMNGPEGGGERCGSSTVVAAAVQAKGAAGAAELAENLAKDPHAQAAERSEYTALAKKLRSGDATYGDLGKLSAAIHKRHAEPKYGADDQPIPGSNGLSGETMSKLMKHKPIAATPDTKNWKDGTSWPAKINIQNNGNDGDHWVLMTKDKSGASKVWDPMPKEGAAQQGDAGPYITRMTDQIRGAQQGGADPSSFGFPSY